MSDATAVGNVLTSAPAPAASPAASPALAIVSAAGDGFATLLLAVLSRATAPGQPPDPSAPGEVGEAPDHEPDERADDVAEPALAIAMLGLPFPPPWTAPGVAREAPEAAVTDAADPAPAGTSPATAAGPASVAIPATSAIVTAVLQSRVAPAVIAPSSSGAAATLTAPAAAAAHADRPPGASSRPKGSGTADDAAAPEVRDETPDREAAPVEPQPAPDRAAFPVLVDRPTVEREPPPPTPAAPPSPGPAAAAEANVPATDGAVVAAAPGSEQDRLAIGAPVPGAVVERAPAGPTPHEPHPPFQPMLDAPRPERLGGPSRLPDGLDESKVLSFRSEPRADPGAPATGTPVTTGVTAAAIAPSGDGEPADQRPGDRHREREPVREGGEDRAAASAVGAGLETTPARVASPAREGEHAPRPAAALAEQVADRIRSLERPGRHELTVRLDPPDLGSVRIEARLDGNRLALRLVAEGEQARDALQQALPRLRDSLVEHGIVPTRLSVDLGGGGATSQQSPRGGPWPLAVAPEPPPASRAARPLVATGVGESNIEGVDLWA